MKFRNFSFLIFCFLVLPSLVAAADFVSIVGIPGIPDNGQNLGQYFNAIYKLSISLAALLAVVKIVGAGAKYMLTDIVPAKGEALADIKGALLGLLVIIGAVLILGTINYDITHTSLEFAEVVLDPPPPDPHQQTAAEFCDSIHQELDDCVSSSCADLRNEPGTDSNLPCTEICEQRNGVYYGSLLFGYDTGSGLCFRSSIALDVNRVYDVQTIECNTASTISCTQATIDCLAKTGYYRVQMTNPTTLICGTRLSTLDGGITTIDPTVTYRVYNDGQPDSYLTSGPIIATDLNQGVEVTGNNEYTTINTFCSNLSPNPPGCILPDSRKLNLTEGVTYYQTQTEDEIAAGDPPRTLEFTDQYKTIDGFISIKYTDGTEILLTCNLVTPSVCPD